MMRRRILQALLVTVGVLMAACLCELSLRLTHPGSAVGGGTETRIVRDPRGPLQEIFRVDPEFGFRPVLGNHLYSSWGTRTNGYSLEKPAGMTRLLFLGDSVIARGRFVDAIRELAGTNRYEYWNAGVESYNTAQEVRYYLRYASAVHPDHVILGFHLNDFETTPVAFYDTSGALVIHAPDVPLERLNPWWFRHSYLYRFVTGLRTGRRKDRDALASEVRTNLALLRDDLKRRGIAFTVVVFPLFKPLDEWEADERDAAARIDAILTDLGIPAINLRPPFEAALTEGVTTQETPGDWWHPGEEMCRRFARYLIERGVPAPPGVPGPAGKSP